MTARQNALAHRAGRDIQQRESRILQDAALCCGVAQHGVAGMSVAGMTGADCTWR
jgi:hypothetical protein